MQENFVTKLESIFSEARPRKMLFMALGTSKEFELPHETRIAFFIS